MTTTLKKLETEYKKALIDLRKTRIKFMTAYLIQNIEENKELRSLKIKRIKMGVKVSDMAKSMGLNYPQLSNLERGKTKCNPRIIELYRKALNTRKLQMIADINKIKI
jgi:DNA-binding XRE family transcriptional regulator